MSERALRRGPFGTSRVTLVVGVVSALLLSLGVSRASGELRTGVVSDPRDVPEALSGARQPDIETVRIAYDSVGTLSVIVRLFEPWTATSQTYPNFGIVIGSSSRPVTYTCQSGAAGDLTLTGALNPAAVSAGVVSMTGYDGSLTPNRTISPDGLETTFSLTAPQLAGRNYICGWLVRLWLPDSIGHCEPSLSNCQRIAYSYTGDSAPDFFFDGFAPVRPACDDSIDNDGDGRTDLADPDCGFDAQATSEGTVCGNGRDDDGDGKSDVADPGCLGKRGSLSEADPPPVASRFRFTSVLPTSACTLIFGVEVLPDLIPVKVFPFGKVRLTVRGIAGPGKGTVKARRLALGGQASYEFRLKPGRYRVTGLYLGDPFRHPSKISRRTVRVCFPRR